MNELMIIPPNNPRGGQKKLMLIRVAALLCAAALIFGISYAGTWAAHGRVQANVSVGASADSQFELLSSIVQSGSELTLPQLFEVANPAVVAISTKGAGQNAFGWEVQRPSSGSGFLVSPDGYIVTNDHVIANASSIAVLMANGVELPATVIGRDPDSDIAVIKIEGSNFPYLPFGDSDALQVGEQVVAIGNPLGQLANSMTVGHISALNRDINIDGLSRNKIQTDTAVNPGNSGGPLLNLRGEVIGIVSAKSVGASIEGLGFAIPSNLAEHIVAELSQDGFVRGRAVLGVQIAMQDGVGDVQVAAVNSDSAAERGGVKAGDVILSANGVAVSAFTDLRAILDGLSPSDTMELRVRRGSEEISIVVILDEYRPAGL